MSTFDTTQPPQSSPTATSQHTPDPRNYRPSFVSELKTIQFKAKKSPRNNKTPKNPASSTQSVLQLAISELSKTNYGTAVDGDPTTNICMTASTIKVRHILFGGGGIQLKHPTHVSCNSSMDRFRCSALNAKVAPMKHGDLMVVDKSTHCIHRYVCNSIQFVNVPLDAIELYPPQELWKEEPHKPKKGKAKKRDKKDAHANGKYKYSGEGNNVEKEFLTRSKEDENQRVEKVRKLQEYQASNKSIYVRCLRRGGGAGSGGSTEQEDEIEEETDSRLHPDPEHIILGSNHDQRPFRYQKCAIREFNPFAAHPEHLTGTHLGMLIVSFNAVDCFTHCGIVGISNPLDIDPNKVSVTYI